MLVKEELIHLNDLSFIHQCISDYGINKGNYNTIDAWFYKQGLKSILERRKTIIHFLEFINKMNPGKKKFGNGGLSLLLQKYYSERLETRGIR